MQLSKKNDKTVETLTDLNPDIICCCFGLLVPTDILNIPKLGLSTYMLLYYPGGGALLQWNMLFKWG